MSDTTHLDEVLSALRHDEGCSAAVGDYRCRCNVEDMRAQARAELTALREIVRRAEEQTNARDDIVRAAADSGGIAVAEIMAHGSSCHATESAVRQWREKRGEKRDA